MSIKQLLLLAALYVVFSAHSCSDDNSEYVVTITINKPTANQVAVKNQAMPIDVVLTRPGDETIHNVKIDILDANGNVVETLINKHYHAKGSATYKEDNYIPKNAGSFKLRVTTTDDDDLNPNVKDASFTVN